jgi:hypothetical protein
MALVSAFLRTGEADLIVVAAAKCSIAGARGKEIGCGNTVWSHTSVAGALDGAGRADQSG